jgi:HK97 gp10 family phage protein
MAEVTGLTEMNADIAALNAQLAAALPGIVLQGAAIVQQEIQRRAPVDTGALKADIDTVGSRRALSASATVQAEDSAQGGVEHYAIFKEYGTSTAAAQPFFRPGVEAARPKVEALVTSRILDVVNSNER